MHFYYDKTDTLKNQFLPDFTVDETYISGSIQIESLKYDKSSYIITVNSIDFILTPASVSELLSPAYLFYIDSLRFSTDNRCILQPVSLFQKQELIKIYTSINTPRLHQEIIPELDLFAFSHEYILVNQTNYSKNGNSCRN